MPRLIAAPAVVAAAGTKPKKIEEFAGRVNSGHGQVSVARMTSPSGWLEPGQRPEFEEITVVLKGMVRVEHEGGVLEVQAGQAVVTSPGEWVRYSTPDLEGAEYVILADGASRPRVQPSISKIVRNGSSTARSSDPGVRWRGLRRPLLSIRS